MKHQVLEDKCWLTRIGVDSLSIHLEGRGEMPMIFGKGKGLEISVRQVPTEPIWRPQSCQLGNETLKLGGTGRSLKKNDERQPKPDGLQSGIASGVFGVGFDGTHTIDRLNPKPCASGMDELVERGQIPNKNQ